jgi:hypothetical protein
VSLLVGLLLALVLVLDGEVGLRVFPVVQRLVGHAGVMPEAARLQSDEAQGRSSIGRAPVSKTGGCRFKSCRPCWAKGPQARAFLFSGPARGRWRAAKAPDEARAYRQLVLDVADSVANAKGGVKSGETGALDKINEALGPA